MPFAPERRASQSGFTIVELMIAMVLGMIVIGSAVALFVNQRSTSRLASQMSDIQNEGRIAIDALARDLRAAGDFGCSLAEPPINTLVTTTAFDSSAGGVRGYDKGASMTTPPAGQAAASAANPASDIIALTGINGVLTTLAAATTSSTADLKVALNTPAPKSGDVAIITDCINLSKFQVTGYSTDSDGNGVVAHAITSASGTLGGGNSKNDLGALYPAGATVATLDTRWWFVGQPTNKPKGLYRVDASSGAKILISPKIADMRVRYEVDSDGDGIADLFGQTASQVSNWKNVTAVSVELLARSDQNVQNVATSYVFGGQTVTAPDRAAYLPLRLNLGLRNR